MRLIWPHLGDTGAGTPRKPGNIGNGGNTLRRMRIPSASAVRIGPETVETGARADYGPISSVSAPEATLEARKCRESGFVSTVSAVTAVMKATGGERTRLALPTPEAVANWGEYLLERAAIMQHDGGVTHVEADRRAWRELLARHPEAAAHFLPGGGA